MAVLHILRGYGEVCTVVSLSCKEIAEGVRLNVGQDKSSFLGLLSCKEIGLTLKSCIARRNRTVLQGYNIYL
jgi:hypothetical protein